MPCAGKAQTIDTSAGPDSVAFAPLKHQIGLAGGLTDHLSTHVHLALEYFRAMFKWHTPIPYLAGADGEEQIIDSVNLGITYEF